MALAQRDLRDYLYQLVNTFNHGGFCFASLPVEAMSTYLLLSFPVSSFPVSSFPVSLKDAKNCCVSDAKRKAPYFCIIKSLIFHFPFFILFFHFSFFISPSSPFTASGFLILSRYLRITSSLKMTLSHCGSGELTG
jgi:hypothetical protein